MIRTPPAPMVVATDRLALLPTPDAVLEHICEQIVDAGLASARWVIFPEGCLPGYPAWVWALPSGIDPLLDTVRAEVLNNAVRIPSDTTDRLCSIVERAHVNVAIGVIVRENTDEHVAIYSSLLFINAQGQIVGMYRTPLASVSAQSTWVSTTTAMPIDESSAPSGIGGI
jgi:nitrilase